MPDGSSRRQPVEVDIRIATAAWRTAMPGPGAAIRRAVRAALATELPRGAATALSVLLTDDAEMRKLNAGWREKDKPTNVLSFPAETAVDPAHPPAYLGDIALALATCRREAKEQGKSLADHVMHLAVHGSLHLIGYDHMNDEEAAAMEPREVEILAGLGVADPYRIAVKKKTVRKTVKKKAVKKTAKTTAPAAKRAAPKRKRAP